MSSEFDYERQRAHAAIVRFANDNGRTWKSKLRALWISGRDEGGLRNARNMIGPSGLDKVTARTLAEWARVV